MCVRKMVSTKQEAIGETQKVTLLTYKATVTSVSSPLLEKDTTYV